MGTTPIKIDISALSEAEKSTLATLSQKHLAGSSWFGSIALLSAINIAIEFFHLNLSFPVGLGTATLGAMLFNSTISDQHIVGGVLLISSALIIGLLYTCKTQTLSGKTWAYIAGLFFYTMDAAVTLYAKDWIALAFHMWGLYSIGMGYYSFRKMQEMLNPALKKSKLF